MTDLREGDLGVVGILGSRLVFQHFRLNKNLKIHPILFRVTGFKAHL